MRRPAVLSNYHNRLFRWQLHSIRSFCQTRVGKARLSMAFAKEETVKIDPRLEEVVNNYRRHFSVPTPASGELRVCPESIKVSSRWSFVDTDMEKRIVFDTFSVASTSEEKRVFNLLQPAKELNESILFTLKTESNSLLRAVGKEILKGDKKQEFIEIWKADVRLGVYDAELAGLHGKIITKGETHARVLETDRLGHWLCVLVDLVDRLLAQNGAKQFYCNVTIRTESIRIRDLPSFQWSADETKLLFVAEKKVPKPESFFTRKPTPESDIGGLYRWKEDWGEQVEGVVSPVIVVLDLGSMKIEVIEKEGSSLGQAVFTPDGKGVVLVELRNVPYRLGTGFCHNRRRELILYEFGTKRFTKLSFLNKFIGSPRFDASGKTLIFLQNQTGGPHAMASELVKIDWTSENRKQEVVVPIPQNPKENEFPGIYWVTALLKNCILSDGRTAFVNSIWHSKLVILKIDLDSGSLKNVTPDEKYGSYQLLSIHNDHLLAARSSPSIRKHLVVGKVSSDSVTWMTVGDVVENPDIKWKILKLRPEDDPKGYFEAIHIYKEQNQKHPLIVTPHGGPHATSIASHLSTVDYYLDCGYGVLFINYRGSLGFGETNLQALPGKVGDLDVKDVYQAVKCVQESGQVSDLLLFGGSHGGFLVGHLAGQYPSTFKACCLLNPVTDLSMMGPSDIPDWYWFESGCKNDFEFDILPTDEDLALMRARSPVAHANKIIAPCFFFLGTNDLRVDKGQGIKLYKNLLGRGVEVVCNMYEDNHSLSNVMHNSDIQISAIKWFDKHTRK